MEKKRSFISYCLLYGAFFIYSVVSLCSKLAAVQTKTVYTALFFGMEILILGIYAIIWQQVLKRFELSFAMSNKGIAVLFSMIWSVLIFHEKITVNNVIGLVIIIAGIGLVSADG